MKIKIIVLTLLLAAIPTNITLEAVGVVSDNGSVPLIPQVAVLEEPEPELIEVVVERTGVNVTLYNEVSGGAYYTGYPVYGTDYVLDCSTYFCNVEGYMAIVINGAYADMYPRGTIATLEIQGAEYECVVVDYRSVEHSDDLYAVGLIGNETKGEIPATIFYDEN